MALLTLVATACSNLPAEEPPPPIVTPAPAELAGLVVHVFQLVTPAVTPEDDWDYHHMPGYTGELRRLFQLELVRAGFTVTVDRADPADLVAVIQSEMPPGQSGVATLALSSGGAVIDHISVQVPVSGKPPKTVHHSAETAVRLVEAMSQSPAVSQFAMEVRARGQQPVAAKGAAQTPGQCEPDPTLAAEPEPPEVECVIEAVPHCQPPSLVRRAWQPIPFVQCPPEIGPIVEDVLGLPAKFSPQHTRERRLRGECGTTPRDGECCYVQFTAQQCR